MLLLAFQNSLPRVWMEKIFLIRPVPPALYLRAISPKWLLSTPEPPPTETWRVAESESAWARTVELVLPKAVDHSADIEYAKRVRGAPIRFDPQPVDRSKYLFGPQEPPLFGVLRDDATNADDVVRIQDVNAYEYNPRLTPEAQPVPRVAPNYFSAHGFSEAQTQSHPRVDVEAGAVRAFVPQQRVSMSTALEYSVQLMLPAPAIEVTTLLDGSSTSLQTGKALIDAIFSPSAEQDRDADTAARRIGLVRSRVSFLAAGHAEPVPLVFPEVQAGEVHLSSGQVAPMID